MKRLLSIHAFGFREYVLWTARPAILVVFLALTATAQSAPRQGGETNYIDRIHFGDLVDIHVAGHLDFDWRGGLTPEGFLDGFEKIPKQIFALCRTEQEVAAEITDELKAILRNPAVQVRVVDRSGRSPATIDGAVVSPTRFQLRRPARLSEIVVAAGGFSDRTSGEILVSRPIGLSCVDVDAGGSKIANDKPTRLDIRIPELLSGAEAANPVIVSGDLIVVLDASPVYLVGAVSTQGRIDFRPQLTLSRAVDSAGGVMKDAVQERISIFRREKGKSSVISANLANIRSNPNNDIALRPFDIIDVPFKGRPPRKLPPVIELEPGENERRAKLPLRIID